MESIRDLRNHVELIAWRFLRNYFEKHHNELSKKHIQPLVKAIRKGYSDSKDFQFSERAIKKILEAEYARYFNDLVNRRSGVDENDETVVAKNNYSHLSSQQLDCIEKRVLNKFLNLPVESQNQDNVIPDWIGYLVMAACYDKRYNTQRHLQAFELMMVYGEDTDDCGVDIESAEYLKRLSDFGTLTGQFMDVFVPQDDEAEEEIPTETLQDKVDVQHRYHRVLKTTQITRHELLKLRLNSEDEKFTKLKLDQLNSIERAIRPMRVAVVGTMSAGKSMFLSALLGQPGLLQSGCGAVTRVLAEIEFVDQAEYTATLSFSSVEDVAKLIEQVKDIRNSQDSGFFNDDPDDQEIAAITTLNGLFENVDEYFAKPGSVLLPRSAIKFVGHEQLKLRAQRLEEFARLLTNNLEANTENYSYTLQNIRITGPFEHLPAGVILVDTPGLDDADQQNSHRTLNELHKFDEVWYANSYDTAMGKETDQQVLLKLLSLPKGPSTKLHVIATKADREKDRDEATRNVFTNNIHLAFCRHALANAGVHEKFLRSNDMVLMKMRQQPGHVQHSMREREKRVTVNFVAARDYPTLGMDYWKGRLQLLGQEYKEKLKQQESFLLGLRTPPSSEGGVQAKAKVRQLHSTWKSAEKSFMSVIDAVDSNAISAALVACWSQLKDPRTIKAIMHPNRAGIFRSQSKKQYFDLNFNIAEHWIQVGELVKAWEDLLSKIEDICANAIALKADQLKVNCFADDVKFAGTHLFELDVKDKIRGMLRGDYVYTLDRRTLPTNEEIKSVLSRLILGVKEFIRKANKTFAGLEQGLLSFQGTNNKEISRILYDPIRTQDVIIHPIEYLCECSKQLMRDPVITQCCDRSIDRSEYEVGKNCMLCGSANFRVYEDPTLQRLINLWIQEVAYEPPQPNWWLNPTGAVADRTTKNFPILPILPRTNVDNDNGNIATKKRPLLKGIPPSPTTSPILKKQTIVTPFVNSGKVVKGVKIGSGGFGTVFKGEFEFKPVAIKYPHFNGPLPETTQNDLLKEVKLMQEFDHPNVVRFYGILVDDENNPVPQALVMELGNSGSLYTFLRQTSVPIDWPLRLRIAKDLAAGLAYLHCVKKIVHQDIKSLNVVLNEHYVAKWCDFGLAQLRTHTSTHSNGTNKVSTAGSLRWLAPERLRPSGKPTFASDIWALGMVFYEIVSGEVPYGQSDEAMIRQWIKDGETEDVPEDCETSFPKFAALIKACWQKNAADRPTAEMINASDALSPK